MRGRSKLVDRKKRTGELHHKRQKAFGRGIQHLDKKRMTWHWWRLFIILAWQLQLPNCLFVKLPTCFFSLQSVSPFRYTGSEDRDARVHKTWYLTSTMALSRKESKMKHSVRMRRDVARRASISVRHVTRSVRRSWPNMEQY